MQTQRVKIETLTLDGLNPGEVVIKTAYSSVNYKDALAGTGEGKILRRFPLVGGIDVAGHVLASTDPRFKEGDAVLCTGSGLSLWPLALVFGLALALPGILAAWLGALVRRFRTAMREASR